ncbi:uncharacterized protein LOC126319869 [Schistocerca gregaria]|uniref:uncharacterized protein LOC126319869 n=1 Tax=Schistocerca gregaria TaxID=7010 RepID=UPI00211EF468|nr:uncharacterized protein LOC126319869 [Schistocerca gregaria]
MEAQRPNLFSLQGIVMISGVILCTLSFLAALISMIKLPQLIVKDENPTSLSITNINFTYGYIAFIALFIDLIFLLFELRIQLVTQYLEFANMYLMSAIFYLLWSFVNIGFAGSLGIAVGVMMVLNGLFILFVEIQRQR